MTLNPISGSASKKKTIQTKVEASSLRAGTVSVLFAVYVQELAQ